MSRSGGTPSPGVMVVFGSSGNLSTTKVLPAVEGELKGGRFRAVGVDRRPPRGGPFPWLTFVQGDLARKETFARLAVAVGPDALRERGALFYLATPPALFPGIVRGLKKAGLARPGSRIAVEKPLGADLKSARVLEKELGAAFARERVYRVDHFLCKDGAVGLAHFRFADGRLEGAWNSRFVDSVQIMADEGSAAAGRGEFYDSVGAVRDMAQSHLLQLLCLVAMDRPGSEGPRSFAEARAKGLKAVAPPSPRDVVQGQYRGYERVVGVRRGSRTPTFVALKLQVRNRRWEGVPFYLRSGKVLARDATEVVVAFRRAAGPGPRLVRFAFAPKAVTTLERGGRTQEWRDPQLRAGEGDYRRVIRGVLAGDQSRFVDRGSNELAWKLFDPIVRGRKRPERYVPGGWGPAASDDLLGREGRRWLDGRSRSSGQGRRARAGFAPPLP